MRGQQEEGSLFLKQLFIQKEDRVMRRKLIFVACVLFLVMVGCAPTSHFGVPDKALTFPDQFGQTEAAIANAERSAGAKYCPEKIAKAKELGKKRGGDLLGLPHCRGYGPSRRGQGTGKKGGILSGSCCKGDPTTATGEAAHQLPLGVL